MKNNINKNSVDFKLSEIYEKFDDLILLHGMSRIGALDNVPREMFDRYSKIKEEKIYGYLIHVDKPFMNWVNAGAIVKESKIISAINDDSGTDNNLVPVNQMEPDIIKNKVNDINDSNLQEHYSELFYENTEVQGIYYIKDADINDYNEVDVRKTQEKFNIDKVYEIYHKSGSIFLVEWDGSKYQQVKRISNREELFN